MYHDPTRLPVLAALAIFDVHPEAQMRSEKAGKAAAGLVASHQSASTDGENGSGFKAVILRMTALEVQDQSAPLYLLRVDKRKWCCKLTDDEEKNNKNSFEKKSHF